MTTATVLAEDCPPFPAETAESFLTNRLPAGEADSFALHAAACPACMEAIDDFRRFLEILKG